MPRYRAATRSDTLKGRDAAIPDLLPSVLHQPCEQYLTLLSGSLSFTVPGTMVHRAPSPPSSVQHPPYVHCTSVSQKEADELKARVQHLEKELQEAQQEKQ